MLPFLEKKESSVAGLSEPIHREPDEPFDYLEACGQDLIDAVHARDAKAVGAAIRTAFEILETMPHQEGQHG